VIPVARSYLADRRLFIPQLIPLTLAFGVLYSQNVASTCEARWTTQTFIALGAWLVAFLSMRVIDDIDDFRSSECGDRYRRENIVFIFILLIFFASLVAVALSLFDLNLAMIALILAIILPALGNFIVKPALTPKSLKDQLTTGRRSTNFVLSAFFEGAPLAAIICAGLAIQRYTPMTLDVALMLVQLWLIFEIWKFGRSRERRDWLPYGLTSLHQERLLSAMSVAFALTFCVRFASLDSDDSTVLGALSGLSIIGSAFYVALPTRVITRSSLPVSHSAANSIFMMFMIVILVAGHLTQFSERCTT
jgi:hypothetical protein